MWPPRSVGTSTAARIPAELLAQMEDWPSHRAARRRAAPARAGERVRLQMGERIICLRFPSNAQRQQVLLHCSAFERRLDPGNQEIGTGRLVLGGILHQDRHNPLPFTAKPALVRQEVRQNILREHGAVIRLDDAAPVPAEYQCPEFG